MSETANIIDATLIAQGVGALILAILLGSFYRHYGKSYLRQWAWSWWMLALFTIAGAAVGGPEGGAISIALAVVRSAAGYLAVGFLSLGCWEIATRRPARLSFTRRLLVSLALFGVASWLGAWLAAGSPVVVRTVGEGLRFLVAGAAFIAMAAYVLTKRERDRGLGFTLVGIALLTYGLQQLHHFALSMTGPGLDGAVGYAYWLGYVDFLLQALLGLGMVTCLLEDERQAAILASNEIEHLAYHDALTGLPNRPLFIDRLIVAIAHATRHRQKLAVFFMDVDGFKDINDTLGHSLGDSLLKAIAERVRRCVRAEDTVSRFGGDEFTLLVQPIDRIEDAARIAQKLLTAVKQPFVIGEHELFVSVSIGISLFPADGADAETLVKNADTAMYRAKEHGRDNYQIYAPAMNARALERLSLENHLRRALDNGELDIYYQPLIDLGSRSVYGAEALLRWRHPEQGILSPYHFIGTLESSGLILPVGDWILHQACRQVRTWSETHGVDLAISINLSARQFQQPDLVDRVRAALEQSGLAPGRVELEITENNAMQNAEHSIRILRELKSLGVQIAVDDFGTGYSSLNYLKRFPIDTLKLDQSFVRDVTEDPGDAAIATAVISMARELKLTVVAEGVETEEQLAFFSSRGCSRLQGFLFSRPLPAAEFGEFLRLGAGLAVLGGIAEPKAP
ncbi:MAG TPA: EAL domain-containing protein [Thermoanaerobaculia bacterium]|nr:EAL domain-containing protein [Thermoanaerobaculia bacterium]